MLGRASRTSNTIERGGAVSLTPTAATTVRLEPASTALTPSYAPMLAKALPAVVTIRVIGENPIPIEIPPRSSNNSSSPLPASKKEPFKAGGSGVIVDAANGYILTNNHVIENATWIQVSLSNGRPMMGTLVGRDIGTDLAIVKVTGEDLPSIQVGDSDAMQVGDIVAAVGNPYGLEGTATIGIISAVMRTDIGHGAFEDFLQMDAQVQPGNSGGALINVRGELIGINTVGGANPGQSAGIGFAIPSNMAMVVMKEIITAGRMRRGSPGLIVADLPISSEVPAGALFIRGAIVKKVLPKSSAAAAGIKAGDLVVSVADKPVRSADEYTTRVETVPLGTSIPFIIFSNGEGETFHLEATDMVLEPEGRTLAEPAGSIAGAVVGEILLGNPLYGDIRGAQILSVPPDTPAFATGLEGDDVIVAVDNLNVRSVDELMQRIARAGKQYTITLERNGSPGYIRVSR